MQRWVGVLLVAVGLIGIVSTPPSTKPIPPNVPTSSILVATHDLQSGLILSASDVKVRELPTSQVAPRALRDLSIYDRIQLLAPVQAGHQIIDVSKELLDQ